MKIIKKILWIALCFTCVFTLKSTICQAADIEYTENLISTLGGTSSASSHIVDNGLTYYPSLAFDGFHGSTNEFSSINNYTQGYLNGWVSETGNFPAWLEFDFQTPQCITKYVLSPRSKQALIAEAPKDWTFQAYNESSKTWITLDTQTNVTNWSINDKKDFPFTNTNYYSKYRINITSSCQDDGKNSSKNVAIGELQMMATKSTTTPAPTPTTTFQGNRALLKITLTNGTVKTYDYPIKTIENFINWYDQRSDGKGKKYYIFVKNHAKPYKSKTEYIAFSKISCFDVFDYDD